MLVCIGMAVAGTAAQEHERRDVKVHAAADFSVYTHSAGTYSIAHPSDWQAHEQPTRTNIGSDSGLVRGAQGGFRTVFGAIIAAVDDPAAGAASPSLEASAKAIVDSILKRNSHQSLAEPVAEDGVLAGSPVYRAVLLGTSPVTGKAERAEILCRRLGPGRLLYIILVSPGESYPQLKPTFVRMRNSLVIPPTTR